MSARRRMACLHLDLTRALCLGKQYRKSWQVVIPLDQYWPWTDASDGISINIPRGLRYRCRMSVDEHFCSSSSLIRFWSVASQMHFTDRGGRKTVDVLVGVVSHVVGADDNIADVTQQPAAGAACDLS